MHRVLKTNKYLCKNTASLAFSHTDTRTHVYKLIHTQPCKHFYLHITIFNMLLPMHAHFTVICCLAVFCAAYYFLFLVWFFALFLFSAHCFLYIFGFHSENSTFPMQLPGCMTAGKAKLFLVVVRGYLRNTVLPIFQLLEMCLFCVFFAHDQKRLKFHLRRLCSKKSELYSIPTATQCDLLYKLSSHRTCRFLIKASTFR